jgi:hypothetical protein
MFHDVSRFSPSIAEVSCQEKKLKKKQKKDREDSLSEVIHRKTGSVKLPCI